MSVFPAQSPKSGYVQVPPTQQRRGSQSGSSVTSHQGAMSGLGLAVLRSRQRDAMLQDIHEGTDVLQTENQHMEDILSEEHRMLSHEDVCQVLTTQFVGLTSSSILANRKSPQRLPYRQILQKQRNATSEGENHVSSVPASTQVVTPSPQEVDQNFERLRAFESAKRGLLPGAGGSGGGIASRQSTGGVNYRVMLDQQAELHSKLKADAVGYQALLKDVVRSQQRIGEGIVDMAAINAALAKAKLK